MSRVRHSSDHVAEAQRLFAGGWSRYQIAKLFRRRGVSVDENTISAWVDPERADRDRRRQAERARILAARRSGGRLGAGPRRGPEFRQARMTSLRGLGMSYDAIAKVMSFDFPGEPVREWQVKDALRSGTPPRVYRELVG